VAEVGCTPPEKRQLYKLEHGSQNPWVMWQWACPVTGERVGSEDEAEARALMLAHDCQGAGWCPTPYGRWMNQGRSEPPKEEDGQLKLL